MYIDTESDINTKEPLSIQWRLDGEHGIVTSFDSEGYAFLRSLWWRARAVIMYNAPYDLGVLAGAFGERNSWSWVKSEMGGYWDMVIFGHRYKVRRISGFRNLIKPFNTVEDVRGVPLSAKDRHTHSTPVIDLLKLWSILVDDGRGGSLRLKELIRRELKEEAIDYSEEAALTDAYRYQDVDQLEKLWHVFLEKTSNIEDVQGYTYEDWSFIKTPATFVKLAYEREIPGLRTFRRSNDAMDEEAGLVKALEEAYHGGITIALRRGGCKPTCWFDIHGAYAHAIEFMNTDQYLTYQWSEISYPRASMTVSDGPVLCRVRSTCVIKSINKSLKIFTLKSPATYWIWNYDIMALSLIFPHDSFDVLEAWKPIPTYSCTESLPARWSRLKEEEQALNGKTTLREYYKFMSNTSYGIKAQRHPFRTPHTNMVIAGMITARVHLVLLEMVDEARKFGMKWVYSDTDSICMEYEGPMPEGVEAALNTRIAPYSCECEGYDFTTRILSLKRYVSENGLLSPGKKAPNKIKLHGKGRYKITQQTIYDGVMNGNTSASPVVIAQLAANTEVTMKQLLNACPFASEHIHPFAFHTNIPSNRTMREWFNKWVRHIDTKMTYEPSAKIDDEFDRDFWCFSSIREASRFFGEHLDYQGAEPEDLIAGYTDWDSEAAYLFSLTDKES